MRHFIILAAPTGGLYQLLHDASLIACRVARVRLALELRWGIESRRFQRYNGRRLALKHCGDRLELGPRAPWRGSVPAHATLGGVEGKVGQLGRNLAAGGGKILLGVRVQLARVAALELHGRLELDLQSCFGVPTLGLGNVQAGMVRVGRPIERDEEFARHCVLPEMFQLCVFSNGVCSRTADTGQTREKKQVLLRIKPRRTMCVPAEGWLWS